MASYVVLTGGKPAESQGEAEEDVVFVRDGFHLVAFLIPFVWLLWHRLWIEGALALAAAVVLAALAELTPLGPVAPVLSLAISTFVGLEAANLRIAALRRRDRIELGVVEADGIEDAEARWFAGESIRAPRPEPVAAMRPAFAATPLRPGPALGLFDYPRT